MLPIFFLGGLDLKDDFDRSFHFHGLVQMILSSIESVDVDLRKELYGSIVISGGNTLFPGMINRLQKEVTAAVAVVS